jgi:Uma2 family endonuclease
MVLGRAIGNFAADRDLGIVIGSDGTVQLFPQRVGIPDVAFIRWEQLPGRALPREAVPHLAPDLVVEVISEGNTREEMGQKLRDYFRPSVRLVWYVYPQTRSVHVYTSANQATELTGEAVLAGGDVLPAFTLPLPELFHVPAGPQKP